MRYIHRGVRKLCGNYMRHGIRVRLTKRIYAYKTLSRFMIECSSDARERIFPVALSDVADSETILLALTSLTPTEFRALVPRPAF
jgi:hypothetical protein